MPIIYPSYAYCLCLSCFAYGVPEHISIYAFCFSFVCLLFKYILLCVGCTRSYLSLLCGYYLSLLCYAYGVPIHISIYVYIGILCAYIWSLFCYAHCVPLCTRIYVYCVLNAFLLFMHIFYAYGLLVRISIYAYLFVCAKSFIHLSILNAVILVYLLSSKNRHYDFL